MSSITVRPNIGEPYTLTDSESRVRRTFVNDYRLTARSRIPCTVIGCDKLAVFGQNDGVAPFWYHCDQHAQMIRRTGRTYE